MAKQATSTFTYEAYVRSSADDVWKAITDGKQTAQYFYGSPVRSSLKVGGELDYLTPDGKGKMAEATIAEVEPKRRIVLDKYRLLYHPGVANDTPSREAWEITAMGDMFLSSSPASSRCSRRARPCPCRWSRPEAQRRIQWNRCQLKPPPRSVAPNDSGGRMTREPCLNLLRAVRDMSPTGSLPTGSEPLLLRRPYS